MIFAEKKDRRDIFGGVLFFIGWLLSPFTWWNDAFINIPISYILASAAYCAVRINFIRLLIGMYWLTNIIGIILMWFGAKDIAASPKRRTHTTIFLILSILVYSLIMLYLDKYGKLLPLSDYFKKICK